MSALLALAALSLGWIALGLFGVRLRAAERWPAAFAVGTPLLAALVLLLVKLHLYRAGALRLSVVMLVALAIWRRRSIMVEDGPMLPRPLLVLCGLGLLAVSMWVGRAALGPDTTPVGNDDTFAAAAEIHRGALKPRWDGTALWSAAFELRGHEGVPLLHSFYLPGLALALLALLRRHLEPLPAVLAALLLATAPAYELFGARSGTQLVWLLCLFSGLWLAHLAGRTSQPRLLLAVLLLAVFSAKLHPVGGGAPGGFVFGWFPWVATLPVAALLGWALRRQPLCLAALLAFQVVTNVSALTARSQPTSLETARLLESDTAPGSVILTERPIARAWTTRRTTAEAALFRMMQTASDEKFRPARRRRQPVTDSLRHSFFVERVGRIVEVRFFLRNAELPRAPAWRVRSLEGELAAALAFDNSYVTGCDCAIEVDFGTSVQFDEVRIDGTEGEFIGAPAGLRRAATLELKRRGVTHVLVWQGGALLSELSQDAKYWGVKEVGSRDAAHLFVLE